MLTVGRAAHNPIRFELALQTRAARLSRPIGATKGQSPGTGRIQTIRANEGPSLGHRCRPQAGPRWSPAPTASGPALFPREDSPAVITHMAPCDPCRRVHHSRCTGRPPCTCQTCYAGAIVSDAARRVRETNSPQLLRASLAEMLALYAQKARRVRRSIYAAGSVPAGPCSCGCGEQVWQSPYGPRKLYVNHAHEMRAWRRRQRQARQAAA